MIVFYSFVAGAQRVHTPPFPAPIRKIKQGSHAPPSTITAALLTSPCRCIKSTAFSEQARRGHDCAQAASQSITRAIRPRPYPTNTVQTELLSSPIQSFNCFILLCNGISSLRTSIFYVFTFFIA